MAKIRNDENFHKLWKLIFQYKETNPDQEYTCIVQSRYPFRGSIFFFGNPACFILHRMTVGMLDQLACPDIPCRILHGKEFIYDAANKGVNHGLIIRNTSDLVLPFYAELIGRILINKNETPIESDWEKYYAKTC